jgi:hypothetical protein
MRNRRLRQRIRIQRLAAALSGRVGTTMVTIGAGTPRTARERARAMAGNPRAPGRPRPAGHRQAAAHPRAVGRPSTTDPPGTLAPPAMSPVLRKAAPPARGATLQTGEVLAPRRRAAARLAAGAHRITAGAGMDPPTGAMGTPRGAEARTECGSFPGFAGPRTTSGRRRSRSRPRRVSGENRHLRAVP